MRLPERFTLQLGGWDYAVRPPCYQVTAQNQEAFVALLREYGVNTPWEGNWVMPVGTYDGEGNLPAPPSRELMDQWLRLWPEASVFCVVLFELPPPDTPHRAKRIQAWAKDWAAYLKERGVAPGRVALLIRDEPTTEAELQTILEVGRAIKAGSGFRIWNDFAVCNTFRSDYADCWCRFSMVNIRWRPGRPISC